MMHKLLLLLPDHKRNRLIRCSLMIFAVLISTGLLAQVTVRGKVTDDSGAGIPGVNILLKGTSTGTTSDADGSYTIDVSEATGSKVLVYSFIGYTTQELSFEGRTVLDVVLATSTQALSEVVVIGYGVSRKADVTGALGSVNSEALQEVPVANITQALQGRVAGVDLNTTSSRPGAGAQIRIRGSRSLTGSNEPLIVLDGIPFNGTINDVNPADIKSMTVLKDASATAIYGSRGSNGVILITTNKGNVGKPQLFYDGYYGVSSAVGKYLLYNGPEFDAFRTEAQLAGAAYTPTADEEANLAAGRQTDWQDEMAQNGFITNHSLGVSGGTEQTQYMISGGYFKQTTIHPGQAFTRYSITGAIDQKIGERIKIGLNTMNSVNVQDGESASFMFQLLTLSPLYNAYKPDGSINELPAIGSVDPQTRNPLLVRRDDNWKQQRRRIRSFNSIYGDVKILEGLTYRLNLGLDLSQDNYGQYLGSNTPFLNGSTNVADVQNTNSWSYTAENLLNYEKTFGFHRLQATALFSAQEVEEYRSSATANTLPADYIFYYNLGLANTSSVPLSNNYYFKWGLLSYMGRVNYSYQDRYLLTLTARADGSSRLAEGNKWFYYPAVAAAWNVSNEAFMQDVGLDLKVRFGIGTTSNQAVAPYSSLGSLGGLDGRSAEPYNFGSNGAYGYLVTSLPNPQLTWEFTTTSNIGLDFGVLKNRISGSVELYEQKTKDILQRVALPPTSGVGSVVKNIGETRNRGFELTLSSINIDSKSSGFRWETDLNIFLNRNEVTYLAGGVLQDINNGWHVGQPIDVIFDYEKIGIVQTGDTDLPPGFVPGQIKIKDQDDNGVINASDRVILGTTQPKWQGGFTTRFTYKGFDLSMVMFWRVGGMLVSNLYGANISNPINSLEGRRNGPKVDYWTPESPTNKYPRPGMGQVPNYGSTLGYFDATFMKIRSINLGYNVPASLLGNTGISSLRIYMQALNPFKAFFSDYVKEGGLDPETNGFGGSPTLGFGPNGTNRLTVNPNTPPTRSIIFGINLKY